MQPADDDENNEQNHVAAAETFVNKSSGSNVSPIEQNGGDVTMEKLQLPWSEKYWNLFIINPKSSVEIWGRLIGAEYSVSVFFVHFFVNLSSTLFIYKLN